MTRIGASINYHPFLNVSIEEDGSDINEIIIPNNFEFQELFFFVKNLILIYIKLWTFIC